MTTRGGCPQPNLRPNECAETREHREDDKERPTKEREGVPDEGAREADAVAALACAANLGERDVPEDYAERGQNEGGDKCHDG